MSDDDLLRDVRAKMTAGADQIAAAALADVDVALSLAKIMVAVQVAAAKLEDRGLARRNALGLIIGLAADAVVGDDL